MPPCACEGPALLAPLARSSTNGKQTQKGPVEALTTNPGDADLGHRIGRRLGRSHPGDDARHGPRRGDRAAVRRSTGGEGGL
jgi:hypothetical protein